MDLSLTSDFDSALLNWDDDDDSGVSDAGEAVGDGRRNDRSSGGCGGGGGGGGGGGASNSNSSPPSSITTGGGSAADGTAVPSIDRAGGPQQPPPLPRRMMDPVFVRLPSFGTDGGAGGGGGAANAGAELSAAMHDLQANMEAALAGVNSHGLPFKGNGGGNDNDDNNNNNDESQDANPFSAFLTDQQQASSSLSPSGAANFPQHLMIGQEMGDASSSQAAGLGSGSLFPSAAANSAASAGPLGLSSSGSKSVVTQRLQQGERVAAAQQQAASRRRGRGEQASVSSGSTGGGGGPATVSTSGTSNATSDAGAKRRASASVAPLHRQQHQQQQPPQPPLQQQQQQAFLQQQGNNSAGLMGQMHPLAMPSSLDCPPHVVGPTGPGAFMTPPPLAPAGQMFPFLYNPLFMQAPMPPANIMAMFQQQQQQPMVTGMQPATPVPQQQSQQQQQQPLQQQQPPQQQPGSAGHGSNPGSAQGGGGGAHTPPPSEGRRRGKSGTKNNSPKKQRSKPAPKEEKEQQQQQQQPPPPFLLFDAPCELRTNFLQSQRARSDQPQPGGRPPPSLALSPCAGDDPNSYHYGMAVNGFHPQLNARTNPILPLAGVPGGVGGTAQPGDGPGGKVQLVDGRHNNHRGSSSGRGSGGGKERNEREQRRAQKITELIEKLRLSMVKGGWKVEMKSKYHTLSTCADYVKHLIRTTKEKEAAIEKAKSDLSIKEQKLEEDKALQESRSDPESVTSSLTASTAGSRICADDRDPPTRSTADARTIGTAAVGNRASSTGGSGGGRGDKKGRTSEGGDGGPSSGTDEGGNDGRHGRDGEVAKRKKVRLTKVADVMGGGPPPGDDGASSMDSSSGEEGGSGGPGGKNISLDKMSSSVSDMTDSNRSSSDGTGGGNGNGKGKGTASSGKSKRGQLPATTTAAAPPPKDDDTGATSGGDRPSVSSSISSTAAVVRGAGSRERRQKHADVVIKEKKEHASRDGGSGCGSRKKRHRGRECTSLESHFDLDYEEVFRTSNVPQLIATPAGRIVTWNDFFLRATGLTEDEAKRLTIFSIVRADKLSTLFELVASALRTGAERALSLSEQRGRSGGRLGTSDSGSSSEDAPTSTDRDSSAGQSRSSSGKRGRGPDCDYSAVTLPCIPFPSNYPHRPNKRLKDHHYSSSSQIGSHNHGDGQESDLPIPLYMTVTLMTDDDPRKRCFHCVLTDSPGTHGKIGSVSSELLAMLFTEHPHGGGSSAPDESLSEGTGSNDIDTSDGSRGTAAAAIAAPRKKQRGGEGGTTLALSDETNNCSI